MFRGVSPTPNSRDLLTVFLRGTRTARDMRTTTWNINNYFRSSGANGVHRSLRFSFSSSPRCICYYSVDICFCNAHCILRPTTLTRGKRHSFQNVAETAEVMLRFVECSTLTEKHLVDLPLCLIKNIKPLICKILLVALEMLYRTLLKGRKA